MSMNNKSKKKEPKKSKKDQPNYIPFKRKIDNLWYMLKQVYKHIPGFATLNLIACIIQGGTDVFIEVYFLKWIIGIIENSTDPNQSFQQIIIIGLIAIGVFILNRTLGRLTWNVFWARSSTEFQKRLHSQMFEKATRIELSCYDDPKFYNDFIWSMNNSAVTIMETFGKLGSIVLCLTRMVFTGFYIFTTDILMISFVVASISISTFLTLWRNKVNYKYSLELNPRIVKRDYIGRVFYLPEYGKEIKLTNVGNLLIKKYNIFIQDMREVVKKHGKKMALIASFDGLSWDFLFYLANLFYLAFKAIVLKALTYANFMGLYNATREFHGSISWIMQLVPQIDQQSMMINNFRKFMAYEPEMNENTNGEICKNEQGKIIVKDLMYTYKGKKEPALNGINLEINPGEKIAIVGYNGAGKSTLIKLLMRLYDPDSGEITFNNKNIKDYNLKSYRDIFGAVFQDYQIFATTVAENVMMDKVTDFDNKTILDALKLSGGYEKIMSLEEKINTELTREFFDTGTNLSGGESQKVAIARVFAKKCSVVVLDEPSSALDPISEYELNKTMLDAAKDSSVIFISHRLSTTRIADRIYMLENGRVIEQGTHDELMLRNGKYAEMFILQASNYVEDELESVH